MASSGNASLPPLVLPFKGDITNITAAFNKVGTMTKKLSGGLTNQFKEARVALNAFGSTMAGFAAPVAAAAGAWATFSSVMSTFERAETLNKTADALGTTVDALDKLNYAAKLSSSSAAELETAIRKMNMVLGAAADNSSEAQDTLSKLGLSVEDFVGLSADEAFLKVADAMNGLASQGERAKVGMEIFGKGASKIATLAAQGSEGIKALGAEGEKFGRTMSSIDVSKLMAAKDSMEKMGTAFEGLGNRLTIALAPLFDWVSEAINDWIGDTKRFDEAFQAMAKGMAIGLGTVKAIWQGLQLMWEGTKITIYKLGSTFADVAKWIVQQASWVGNYVSAAWTDIKQSFAVTADSIVLLWKYVKSGAILAFAEMQEAFGKAIRAMGEAAASSRLKGLADVGRSAQEAGAELIVGATKLKQGIGDDINAAKKSLGDSLKALHDSREAFEAAPKTAETPYLDAVSAGYKKLADEAIDSMRSIADEIRAQDGGNAWTQALNDLEKKTKAFHDRSVKQAEEAGQRKLAVVTEVKDRELEYMRDAQKRLDEMAFNTFKREEDAYERKQFLESHKTELVRAALAEQDAAHAEFIEMGKVREEAALIAKQERMIAAKEEFNELSSQYDEELEAKTEEMKLEYAKRDQEAQIANAAKWKSGWQGKMDVMSGFLGAMSTLMESGNRKMFEVGKAAAIGQTIIDTYTGATAAFKAMAGIPLVGPALGAAAAGAAVAGGMARLQQIRSTSFGSGGAGGGGVAATPSASSAPYSAGAAGVLGMGNSEAAAASPTNVNLTLQGHSFSDDQIRSLVSAINNAAGDNMNIKTVSQ